MMQHPTRAARSGVSKVATSHLRCHTPRHDWARLKLQRCCRHSSAAASRCTDQVGSSCKPANCRAQTPADCLLTRARALQLLLLAVAVLWAPSAHNAATANSRLQSPSQRVEEAVTDPASCRTVNTYTAAAQRLTLYPRSCVQAAPPLRAAHPTSSPLPSSNQRQEQMLLSPHCPLSWPAALRLWPADHKVRKHKVDFTHRSPRCPPFHPAAPRPFGRDSTKRNNTRPITLTKVFSAPRFIKQRLRLGRQPQVLGAGVGAHPLCKSDRKGSRITGLFKNELEQAQILSALVLYAAAELHPFCTARDAEQQHASGAQCTKGCRMHFRRPSTTMPKLDHAHMWEVAATINPASNHLPARSQKHQRKPGKQDGEQQRNRPVYSWSAKG